MLLHVVNKVKTIIKDLVRLTLVILKIISALLNHVSHLISHIVNVVVINVLLQLHEVLIPVLLLLLRQLFSLLRDLNIPEVQIALLLLVSHHIGLEVLLLASHLGRATLIEFNCLGDICQLNDFTLLRGM